MFYLAICIILSSYIIKKALNKSRGKYCFMPITVLIANRGEIAIRIIRSCRLLNMKTIAIFLDSEATSMHVRMADEAYSLGDGTVQETYLNISKIIEC